MRLLKSVTIRKIMAHLTLEQRFFIDKYIQNNIPKTQTAKALGVDRTTIYRELKRNISEELKGIYNYQIADKLAIVRKKTCSPNIKNP